MENRKTIDYILLSVVIALMLLGLIMILSASSIRALEDFNDSFYLFRHQLAWSVIGVLAMIFFMNLDYHIYQKYAKLILVLTIIALIMVLIPGIGKVVGGSRRWIIFGPIRIQPSELAKLGMVIYLSQFFARKGEKVKSFTEGLMPPLIILGIVFLLILLEPDLGTAITIAGTVFIMLFVAGARYAHLGLLILISIPLLLVFIYSEDYRRERLFSFLDPWSDPLNTGYHIIQSLLALGSGGIFGVGLGQSKQKFLYLPEPGTDFIFAIIGEELGLIGTLLVLFLFFLFAWRGLKIAIGVPDLFASLLATGITSMVILQALINIAVVTSSMPVTGITLPFISYGGTSLVIMLSSVGILLNISRYALE
ncbi:MAG: stage V sporulation protein E [Halanaerobiaceae bacterium]|nr:stage V sporulation protein E [Halanaerobiaceae bacterium]